MNMYLHYNVRAKVLLSRAAGRALGAVRSQFQNFRNIGFSTFTTMFEASVLSILEYRAGIWGCEKHVERVEH